MSIDRIRDSWKKDNTNTGNFESISKSRIRTLKNLFENKKAVIFTCGPSLKNITQKDIQTLIDQGYIIICVKQAIDHMPNRFCHFHVSNFCNEQPYSYNVNSLPIKIYCQFSEGPVVKKSGYDIIVSHYPNHLKDNIVVPMMNNQDTMSFDKLLVRDRLKVKWGDTMYELAIPLALYIGCNHIYIVGWDCKNFKQHFYGNDSRPTRDNMRQKLDNLLVQSSSHLSRFLKDHFGVTIRLVGQGTESIFDIPYVPLQDLLNES